MRKLALLLALIVSFCAVYPAQGKSPYMPEDELKAEARQGLEEILDLWREGKYADLYERTSGGKQTKESFVAKLSDAVCKPACCWEKMQDVKVGIKGDSSAEIRAKLGFEGGKGTEFKTRSFRLVKEDGVWRIGQSDILSLAGSAKKKGGSKKKK
ncbi:MAG: hypothetical protein FD174_532 [Geobacteraceae bacterium]|nr:MAG: hypothetical protein FD174_532 [Geobacteraceae bacterium]